MSAQLKSFGANRRGEDPARIARELAGDSDAKVRDPNWVTCAEAAVILGVSSRVVYSTNVAMDLKRVAAHKIDCGLLVYALLDIERIGAIRRHNHVTLREACRLFCEENE